MSTGKLPPGNPPPPRPPQRQSQRRRNPWPVAVYWSTFILCAGGSFAAGFWFTYSYTSQVGTRGLTTAVAPQPGTLITPIPAMATPEPFATPADLFASEPTPTPIPLPTERVRTPTPEPQAVLTTPEPAYEEPPPEVADTPEPAPAEDVYRVQVGSYESRDAAEQMVQELLSAGIQAVVVYDSTKYHAQVGAFSSKERALAVADEVNAKGYSVTIRH
ncbi:MAG: SPOR domain-containing protein [Candidatus Sericytochromatia bacterium]|nr:SPOR domain-containing protein [Candidatus Tanganyikabacteria bacterium]